jgi:hypothetical protein
MSADAPPASEESPTPAPAAEQPKPADAHRGTNRDSKDGQAPDVEEFRDSTSFGKQDSPASATYEREPPFRAGVEAFVMGGEGQRVHVGHNYIYAGRAAAPPPGPVRTDVLDTLRERYVKVRGYPDLLAGLRERRLLMLGGAPGTGRSNTALHLLDRLAKGKVLRLDATADLCIIGEDALESGRGYLGEMADGGVEFTVTKADRLAELLARCDCYLVVVVTPDYVRSDAFPVYGLECPPPDADELLDRQISAQLRLTDPEDLQDRLTVLAAEPTLRAALGPRPSVAEIVGFAKLLVAHGRAELTRQQVEVECSSFVKRQVIEWFGALRRAARGDVAERAMRLAGFQLSLAVFNEMPHSVVAQSGEDLAVELIKTVHPLRTPGRPLFTDPDVTLLEPIRAHTAERHVYYSSGSVPVGVVCFQDDRYPQAVLSHVWQQHHNMRPPLIRWLQNLAQDPRDYVWTCAAEAAGVLAWVDFPATFDHLLGPAASTEPPEDPSEHDVAVSWQCRWFAALALDQASQDDRLRTVVEGILRGWRRRGNHSERCTAAIAHGYHLGHRSVETSLDELRIIATPQELDDRSSTDEAALAQRLDLIWAAGLSIARLFATGARYPVLARLSHWIERREHPERHGRPQRESLRRLALQTVILIADIKVRSLSERWFTGTHPGGLAFPRCFEERRRWPLLLALLDDDPSIGDPVAHLLRQALRSTARKIALKKLGSWMQAAQADTACFAVLADLLPNLVEHESDRARLLDLIHRRRLAWADALPPDIADQLAGMLAHNANGKRGTDERR